MNTHHVTYPQTTTIYGQLALKDWTLNRWPLLGYLVVGLLSLLLFTIDSPVAFHSAIAVLVSAVIVVGIHLVFGSIINEASNKTLPFILSLPITFVQYSVAKLLFVMGSYTVAWLVLVGGLYAVVASQPHMLAGMIPFYLLVMGYLFVAFVLTLAVAMVTESNVWTIAVMSVCNICISIVMMLIGRVPAINATMESDAAHWNSTSLGLLAGEGLLVLALLALILFCQSRKTEFI
jgi:ABC-type transport system involved in multi-copper enzyme maturation permease subunit